jgi:hypothetical protein
VRIKNFPRLPLLLVVGYIVVYYEDENQLITNFSRLFNCSKNYQKNKVFFSPLDDDNRVDVVCYARLTSK